MKEIKPDYYSSMPEMFAEPNTKIPAGPNAINLHSDGFDICFLCDFFPERLLWLYLMEYQ